MEGDQYRDHDAVGRFWSWGRAPFTAATVDEWLPPMLSAYHGQNTSRSSKPSVTISAVQR